MEENKTAESLKSEVSEEILADESGIMDMSADEFREILADLRKTNQEQADYAKRAWIMSLISTVAVLIVALFILLYGAFMIPQINSLLNEAQISLNNVAEITNEISKVDFEGLIDDVGGLVTTTEKDLEKTMSKIEELDIDDLNKGIKNLSDVIEPLSDFFGVLGDKTESTGNFNVFSINNIGKSKIK